MTTLITKGLFHFHFPYGIFKQRAVLRFIHFAFLCIVFLMLGLRIDAQGDAPKCSYTVTDEVIEKIRHLKYQPYQGPGCTNQSPDEAVFVADGTSGCSTSTMNRNSSPIPLFDPKPKCKCIFLFVATLKVTISNENMNEVCSAGILKGDFVTVSGWSEGIRSTSNGNPEGFQTFEVTKLGFLTSDQDFSIQWIEYGTGGRCGAKAEITYFNILDQRVFGTSCYDLTCFHVSSEQAALPTRSPLTYVNVGKSDFGKTSATVEIPQAAPSEKTATPKILQANGGEVIYDDNGLRQVKTDQALLDIKTASAFKFSMEQYGAADVGAKSNGFYQVSGTPVTTITVSNPNQTTNNVNELLIVQSQGGQSVTNRNVWSPSNQAWTIDAGNGLVTLQGASYMTNSNTVRVETLKIYNTNDNQVVGQQIMQYQVYPWGTPLAQSSAGTVSASTTAAYTYWTNTTDSGYRLVHELFQPTGNVKCSDYDTNGRLNFACNAFLNQTNMEDHSLMRLASYDYTLLSGSGDIGTETNTPRTTIEYLLNNEVSRKYLVVLNGEKREIQCQNPGAAWNDANNLVTITKYFTNGYASNWVSSVLSPNGVLTLYEFYTNSTLRTNIVYSGQPGAGLTNVVDGTKTVTIQNIAGQSVLKSVTDIASGIEIERETYSNFDALSRPQRVTYLDGTFKDTVFGCCGIESETDRDGVTTSYTYDDLKRLKTKTRNGITLLYNYDAAGRTIAELRQGTNGSTVTLRGFTYDVSGLLTAETNALGGVTFYAQGTNSNGGITKTNTYPDLGTRIEEYARDGSLMKLTGTSVRPVRYEYGVDVVDGVTRPYTKEIRLDSSYADTSEWTITYKDMLGRDYKTLYSDPSGVYPFTQKFYNNKGQLWKEVDQDGVTKLYGYNTKGGMEYTALDMNRNDVIDLAGPDRVTRSVSDVLNDNGTQVQRVRNYVWASNYVDSATLTSTTETSVNGLTNWSTSFGLSTRTETSFSNVTNRTVKTIAPDNSLSISFYQNGILLSSTRQDSNSVQIGQVSYGYDAHGRQLTVTDARTGTTTTSYNNADLAATVASPVPGAGLNAQTNSMAYDNMLRAWKTTYADGSSITNEFYLTGNLKKVSGSRTSPVEYTYDAQGRMKTMKTWKSLVTDDKTEVTGWSYDGYRGFLSSKAVETNNPSYATSYNYKPSGRVSRRTWVRGVVCSYDYSPAGQIEAISYSDGITAPITYTYDRLGRQISCNQNGIVTDFAYNDASQMLWEKSMQRSVSYSYDSLLRLSQLIATNNGVELAKASYGYDAASRLLSVTNGLDVINYSYLTNSSLVQQTVFKDNGTVRMTTTKGYDNLNRLTLISNVPSAPAPWSYAYQYNNANQRTQMNLGDGSYWKYSYDSLGQVTSGKRQWSDNSYVAGQQYEYTFNDIGDRTLIKNGGDGSGSNLRSANYYYYSGYQGANLYSARDIPSSFDVTGIANASASVTVNGQAANRKNEYYQASISVSNVGTSLYPAITVTATLEGASQSQTGNVFVPGTGESFTSDDDGNLLTDRHWTNTWDGENRLIAVQARSNIPDGAKKRVEFDYDYQGRRTKKRVYNWDLISSSYLLVSQREFIYDGWNLLAEVNNGVLARSYVWGTDLGGSLQGAGGVGGLVAVKPASGGVHFAAYDGNGNVVGLVDASNGTSSANYEYGPFGEPIRVTGTMGKANPFRWSTKYTDDETDLVYYGKRFYNQSTGRWLSRDPIEEKGGLNLYAFCKNDSVNSVDPFGEENIQVSVRTEIRPPHVENGIKTLHSVTIDDRGSKIAETTFVGITPIPAPLPGVGTLSATVTGDSPQFTIAFSGSAYSLLPKAGGTLIGGLPGGAVAGAILRNLVIDYAINVDLDFCAKKGKVSGAHDGFPSYVVIVKNKVYDFQQTTLPALLPPMEITPDVSFSW